MPTLLTVILPTVIACNIKSKLQELGYYGDGDMVVAAVIASEVIVHLTAADASGPGQEIAILIIGLARAIVDQGNQGRHCQVDPGPWGVGGEQAGRPESEGGCGPPLPRNMTRHYSLAFLGRGATE